MPQRLARAAHAHGEVQQAQLRGLVGILFQDVLVAAHACEVVDIAGFGHADDGMNQQVRLGLLGGPERQFLVGAMQGVAGLEGDDAAPAQFAETPPQLRRRVAQQLEIVIGGRFDAANAPAQVNGTGAVPEVADGRMGVVRRAVDAHALAVQIGFPDVGDIQHGDQHAFRIAQCDRFTFLDALCERFADIEIDRYRPEHAVHEAHLIADPFVIVPGEVTLQRRKGAVHEQVEVAQLARGQVPGRTVSGLLLLEVRLSLGPGIDS